MEGALLALRGQGVAAHLDLATDLWNCMVVPGQDLRSVEGQFGLVLCQELAKDPSYAT